MEASLLWHLGAGGTGGKQQQQTIVDVGIGNDVCRGYSGLELGVLYIIVTSLFLALCMLAVKGRAGSATGEAVEAREALIPPWQ
jgi:hypothetical protein